MLEILGTIFGAIFSGGATGIIGMVAQRYADYKNKQLEIQLQQSKYDNEIKLKEAEAKIMAQEWAARAQVASIEAAGDVEVEDAKAFAESMKMEPTLYSERLKPTKAQSWLFVCLDTFRGSIRPGLTVYLCIITTMVYLDAKSLLMNEDMTPSEALDLTKMIIGTVLYLTTTCVLWWFGTRNKQSNIK